MKSHLLLGAFVMLVCTSLTAWSQEPRFLTVSGGYSFVNIEDTDLKGTGFRANVLYQGIEQDKPFAHGYAIGYIMVTASRDSLLPKVNPLATQEQMTIDYTVSSVPLYYAPMYTFGGGAIKGFVKGAVGLQFAWITRKASNTKFSDTDLGFYGGASAGILIPLNEKIVISAEYEWAYASNSFYHDGFMNSAMAGLRFAL